MIIHLRNVKFSYPDRPSKTVLDIPKWSVLQGEQLFIHGPSGCGKSTLLSLLSGMLSPSDGEISVLDQRLDNMSGSQRDRFRANHIGYVFQQFNLIPYLNAIENVQLAQHFFRPDKSLAVPHQLSASNAQESPTQTNAVSEQLSALGINTLDQLQPTAKLSIGQQQRVAIARAMVNRPQLLIADEPTSSLDSQNRDNFMDQLTTLASKHNITLLFVSHDLSLAHYFHRSEALVDINHALQGEACL